MLIRVDFRMQAFEQVGNDIHFSHNLIGSGFSCLLLVDSRIFALVLF